jgi:hypothetical protein
MCLDTRTFSGLSGVILYCNDIFLAHLSDSCLGILGRPEDTSFEGLRFLVAGFADTD